MRTAEINGALDHYRRALNIDKELAAADPGNDQALLDMSFSESKLGSALGKSGKTAETLAMLYTKVRFLRVDLHGRRKQHFARP